MSNFLTQEDLNRIQGLLHYLNKHFINDQIDATCVIGDSNGEQIGAVEMGGPDGNYIFEF